MTFPTGVIPPRSKVGYLDPEIAGEGQKVQEIDSDAGWRPPPVKPVIPDLSGVKSLQRYFNRTKHSVYPAWLYHPTFEPRLVNNAQEAAQLGIHYREATNEERTRYGREYVWDYWTDNSEWRHQPINPGRFDPTKLETGKTFVASQPNPAIAQNAMIADLIPAVAAAVAQSLKIGTSAPANIKADEWNEFLEFKAWKEASKTVTTASELDKPALSADAPTEEIGRELWENEARRKGIKVDGRWSLETLKAMVEKAE